MVGSVADDTQHACALPVSDEQLWEMSAAFVADGIAADDRVVYFDDGTADQVLERLDDDDVPVADVLARGQLEIARARTTHAVLSGTIADTVAKLRASIDRALADGFRGWRMTGTMTHGLSRDGGLGLVDHDRAIDAGIAGRPAKVLCFYDRRRYPDTVQARLRAIHRHELTAPAMYDDGLLRITRTGLGAARLAGEADHSNHGMLDRLVGSVLDEVLRAPAGPEAVTVDVASLRFLDVAGAVALVQAAERFPSAIRLRLRAARPRVERVLDRCGAPFATQLDVLSWEQTRGRGTRGGQRPLVGEAGS